MQGGELAFFHLGRDFWPLLDRFVEELYGEDVTDSIGREVSEEPVRPVNVLQHAFGVAFGGYAKVLFHLRVPGGGKVQDGEFVLDKGNLKLEAQKDVQIIGDLVGLDSDARRLEHVDRAVECFEIYST
jgi:hypothetical protein